MAKKDIIIDIGADASGVYSVIKGVRNSMNMLQKSVSSAVPKSNNFFTPFKQSIPQIKGATEEVNNFGKEAVVASKKVAKTANMSRGAFLGLGLSVMFFGMALKRVFDTIWKSSTKTFQDVMHSVEGTVTGFDILDGSVKNLGFTMGQALEPVVYWLAPIVDTISEWVNQNPKLAAGTLIVVGVLGTMMMVLGQVGLLLFSIIQAWPAIAIAAKVAWAFISAIFSGGFAVIAVWALAIYGLISAAFMNAATFAKDVMGVLWNTIKSIAGNLKEVFKGVFMVLTGLFTGDWKKVWNGVVKIALNTIAALIKAFMGLSVAVLNVFVVLGNTVKDIFFNIIGVVMKGILLLAGAIDKVAGTSFSGFVQNAIDNWETIQTMATIPTISQDFASQGDKAIESIKNQIEVYVTLDGDQVADKTATRIVEKTNTTG